MPAPPVTTLRREGVDGILLVDVVPTLEAVGVTRISDFMVIAFLDTVIRPTL